MCSEVFTVPPPYLWTLASVLPSDFEISDAPSQADQWTSSGLCDSEASKGIHRWSTSWA